MSKIFRVDCHCHPLDHVHYPMPAWDDALSESDRTRIEDMLHTQIDRGMDAVCITDHNQFSSGLYARDLAARKKLPIIVVPGAECSVILPDGLEVHVLALGVDEPFDYDENDDISTLVESIHDADGVAVLAHPHYYRYAVPGLLEFVDGVEEYNGVNAANCPTRALFDLSQLGFKGFTTQGSDFHLKWEGKHMHSAQLKAETLVDESNAAMYNIISRS